MSAQYLGTGYSKVVADLFGEVLLDLSVSRDRRHRTISRVLISVAAAFPLENAPVLFEVLDQILQLHA